MICGVAGIGTAFVLMLYSRDLKHTVQRKDNFIDQNAKTKSSADSGVKLLLSPPILMCLVFFTLLSLGSTGIASFLIVALGQHHGTAVGR